MRKLNILMRFILINVMVFALHSLGFSQIDKYSVSADWKLYSVKDQKVSFLMPRLPVLINESSQCKGEAAKNFAAYNDGAVYAVRIVYKVEPPKYCTSKKNFDENNFLERLKELTNGLSEISNSTGSLSKNTIIKLSGTNGDSKLKRVVKIVNDFDNSKWIELTVSGADESKPRVKEFFDSFKMGKGISGLEVGQGAEQVYGDATETVIEEKFITADGKSETIKRQSVKTENNESEGMFIIMKPRANYTEDARWNKVQGKVVLRVTFNADGGIGAIAVVNPPSPLSDSIISSGSDYGLIDEAIKAARKICFIPAQRNGVRYSVSRIVEYSFTIY